MAEHIYVRKGQEYTNKTVEAHTYVDVMNGGSASDLYLFGGRLTVSKGGIADYISAGKQGNILIEKGGRISSSVVSASGTLNVYSGGVASDVTLKKGGSMWISHNGAVYYLDWTPGDGYFNPNQNFELTFANRSSGVFLGSDGSLVSSWAQSVKSKAVLGGGSMYVMFGGAANDIAVEEKSSMYVFSGGTASGGSLDGGMGLFGGVAAKTSINDYGRIYVYRGGVASGTTVKSGGKLIISSGGTATDIVVAEGGIVSVETGGIVSGITLSAGAMLYISKGGMAGGITSQTGAYVDVEKGGNKNWKGTLLPLPSQDCDDGWNSWLYNAKTKERNRFLPWAYSGVVLSSGFKSRIQVDEKKTAGAYDNFVGYRDDTDFQKIRMKSSAKLSFTVTADDALKFTLWRLSDSATYDDLTPKYKLKALQTVTLKWDAALGKYVANTASLMLEKGDENFTEYFISVQNPKAAQGSNAYYNVQLNYDTDKKDRATTYFFSDGDDNLNDWLCTKKDRNPDYHFKSTNITQSEEIQVDETKLNKLIGGTTYHNFVGFGDEKDYGKITLKNNGKLYFSVTATDAAKFSVYKVVEKETKSGITYSAKSLLSGTLKKKDGVYVYSNAKGLQLLSGVSYYICVQSTNAKKSEFGAYYNVTIGYEKLDTVKEGKMADALTGNDWGVSSGADELRIAGIELTDTSTGGLDGRTGAGGGSALQDDLNIGQSFAETNAPAIGAASTADILPDDKTGWQNLASLA